MDKPKLSVSIITYNHGKFIAQTLDSVIQQRVNFKFEIVVGEDYSTDNTREILVAYRDKYPNIIKLVLQNENIGTRSNFWEVLQHCSGQYIAHLDGDDIMLPNKLQKQVDFLDNHPEYVMCIHNVRVFESNSNKTLYYFNDNFRNYETDINDLVKYGTYFANCSKVYRRKAIPEDGLDQHNNYIIDWLYHIQNAKLGKIGYIDEVLGEYRKHSGGTTSTSPDKMETLFREQVYTLSKAKEFVSNEVFQYGLARLYFAQSWYYFSNKLFSQYQQTIKNSFNAQFPFVDWKHKVLYQARLFPKTLYAMYKLKKLLFGGANVF